LKLTTDRHEASRGLSARAGLFVADVVRLTNVCIIVVTSRRPQPAGVVMLLSVAYVCS